VLETECLEGLREEMFVHRNLGALVSNGDLSTESAVEWCVNLLKVCWVNRVRRGSVANWDAG
jgi:carbonic anhydrase